MRKTVAAWIFALVLSIALTVYCVYCVFEEYFLGGEYWLLALSGVILIAQIFLASVFHELGHMLFGALVKIKAKPHFRLFLPSDVDLIPLTEEGLKCRVVVTALGGCIVNFWFVILGLVALAVPAVPTCLCMLAPPAFYLGFFNLMPVYTSGGKTDGAVVTEISKDEDCAKVLIAVLTVQAQVLRGKPLSEIDKSLLFDLPTIREDDPAFIALMQLRRDFFEATGDCEGAKACEERIENIM